MTNLNVPTPPPLMSQSKITPPPPPIPANKKKSLKPYVIVLLSILGVFVLCFATVLILGISDMKGNEKKTAIVITELLETLTAQPTATNTSLPTITPTFTLTFTPTITPTLTPTETPVPPYILTKTAVQKTQTQQAINYLSTIESKNATATEIASYKEISSKELSTYPDNYIGQKLKIYGRVFNVIDNYTLQIYFAGTYDAAVISVSIPLSGIYEDDVVYVYGIGSGEWCGENAFGGSICQPLIENAMIVKRQ